MFPVATEPWCGYLAAGLSVPQKLTGTALPAKLFPVSLALGRALPQIRMQDGAEFCLPGEVLTYGPINAVIGKARDNIYLEKPLVGNKWPHLQLR